MLSVSWKNINTVTHKYFQGGRDALPQVYGMLRERHGPPLKDLFISVVTILKNETFSGKGQNMCLRELLRKDLTSGPSLLSLVVSLQATMALMFLRRMWGANEEIVLACCWMKKWEVGLCQKGIARAFVSVAKKRTSSCLHDNRGTCRQGLSCERGLLWTVVTPPVQQRKSSISWRSVYLLLWEGKRE